MNELLNLALDAHGGLDRWNKVKSVRMTGSITGAIWYLKGKPDYRDVDGVIVPTKRRIYAWEATINS